MVTVNKQSHHNGTTTRSSGGGGEYARCVLPSNSLRQINTSFQRQKSVQFAQSVDVHPSALSVANFNNHGLWFERHGPPEAASFIMLSIAATVVGLFFASPGTTCRLWNCWLPANRERLWRSSTRELAYAGGPACCGAGACASGGESGAWSPVGRGRLGGSDGWENGIGIYTARNRQTKKAGEGVKTTDVTLSYGSRRHGRSDDSSGICR